MVCLQAAVYTHIILLIVSFFCFFLSD